MTSSPLGILETTTLKAGTLTVVTSTTMILQTVTVEKTILKMAFLKMVFLKTTILEASTPTRVTLVSVLLAFAIECVEVGIWSGPMTLSLDSSREFRKFLTQYNTLTENCGEDN